MPGSPVFAPADGVRAGTKAAITADPVSASCCSKPAQPAAPMPIEQLLVELRAAFDAEKALGFTIDNQQDPVSFKRLNEQVQGLLKAYTSCNGADWQRFALFNNAHYVRNLVEASEDFELIVLCWQAGQVSRVHNHSVGHCWLAVLDGDMREVQYRLTQPPPQGQAPQEEEEEEVLVEPTKTTDMKVGDVGYINDHLALHSVGCYSTPEDMEAANSGRRPGDWHLEGGVTLHLYSPPIRNVKIYEDNTVKERVPGYYSKGGVRV